MKRVPILPQRAHPARGQERSASAVAAGRRHVYSIEIGNIPGALAWSPAAPADPVLPRLFSADRELAGRYDDLLSRPASNMKLLKFVSPFGLVIFRAIDPQATMGAFVGKFDVRGKRAAARGRMIGWRYVDGAAVQPSDAYMRSRRPAAAMK